MAPPRNFTSVQGVTVNADQLNTTVQWTTNVASLRAFTGALNDMLCYMEGTTTPNDGGQGFFYYNAAATAPDDGVNTIVPTGNLVGAWIRTATGSAPDTDAILFNVMNYGAKGNGADDTLAWQAAAAALRSYVKTMPFVAGTNAVPALLYAPPGYFGKLTGSINLQNLNPDFGWGIWGYGAAVIGSYAGIIFDCLGSRYGTISGITIYGDSAVTPTIGIAHGQLINNNADTFFFDRVLMDGWFSDSCLHNISCTLTTYDNVVCYNHHLTGVEILIDGAYHVPVVSAFTSPTLTPDTQLSSGLMTLRQCTLQHLGTGSPHCISIYATSPVIMDGCYCATTGSCIYYWHLASGPSPSNLNFDTHCETNTYNVIFDRSSSGAVTVFEFALTDHFSEASVAVVGLGANATALDLRGGQINLASGAPVPGGGALFAGAAGTIRFQGIYQWQPVSADIIGDQAFDLGTIYNSGAVWGFMTNAAFSTARTWTLPAASAGLPGSRIKITDNVGGITNVNTLTLARAGSDLINGASSLPIIGTYAVCELETDGVSNWTIVSLESAWAAYTFTPASSSGTLTSASGSGRYRQSMRSVICTSYTAITTNGSGSGNIHAPLPYLPAQRSKGIGNESAVSGASLYGQVIASTAYMTILTYNDGYPGADGANIGVYVEYEI